MRKTILIAGVAICIICAALISYGIFTQRDAIPPRDLALSDYPKLFVKEVVIVIGENATQIEKESAEAIAANLENLTGNKPEIINTKKIESFKYSYNLITLGTPKSNEILGEVYKMTDAIRVTDEYPGEGKGILEILRNPWNEEKAMLLVEGSDEWGVKAAASKLEQTYGINETSVIAELEKDEDGYKIFLASRQFVPSPGISARVEANITTSPLERVHVLIQFYRTPNAIEREVLEDADVNLLGYIPNNAWFVSIPTSENCLMKIMNTPIVRSVVGIQPEDKMQDVVKKREFGNWSFDPVTNSVNLTIIFFKDVSSIDAEQIISRYNGVVIGTAPIINAFVVKFPVEFISALASEDSIKWIEEVPPPGTEDNDRYTDNIENISRYNQEVII